MFKTTHLDFRNAGTLNPLVLAYLERSQSVTPFYDFFPDKAGFAALLKSDPYAGFDRELLATTLLQQAKWVENTSDLTLQNIEKLKEKNTFTVTTGHQLCLFTGPLYFIYKIISAIKLAKELAAAFPEKQFVPVYWMASEDHDFEEVSSFSVNGKKISWKSAQSGAVGDFQTGELKALLPELRDALGISEDSNYLLELFERAYIKHSTLANATRYLVNALFGNQGLISLDGNDKNFKHQFKDIFQKDIFDNIPQNLVNQSIEKLEALHYPAQVKPRPINCFYLAPGERSRIEKDGTRFNLVGTNKSFSEQELREIIDAQPETISPNVVLRPLYQQVILPNIAYIGGPGELAYWLELRNMFDELRVSFPILVPRNFISVVDKPTHEKISKLSFSAPDFFKSEQELIKEHLVKTDALFDLEAEMKSAEAIYEAIAQRTDHVDITLSRHVQAARQRALNQLATVVAKTNRALKKKAEIQIDQIENIKQRLFPKGMPQERYDNFASLYLKYGASFFSAVENAIDPFLLDQKILIEE